jgi:hypothetical protein
MICGKFHLTKLSAVSKHGSGNVQKLREIDSPKFIGVGGRA